MSFRPLSVFLAVLAMSGFLYAQETVSGESQKYRIDSVDYHIKGATRQFPLSQAVPIDKKKIFSGQSALLLYINDLHSLFLNQRVLQSAEIEPEYGTVGPDGVIPVKLTIRTVDTWNIIALPKPSFDSNSGFELKLKLKNYNFFGSMHALDADLAYGIDNDGRSTFESNLGFDIPFQFKGYAMTWNNDLSVELPEGELPEFNLSSGVNLTLPVTTFANVVFTMKNKYVINDRTSEEINGEDVTKMYHGDASYLAETFSVSFPVTLVKSSGIGDLVWSPNASINRNFDSDGIQNSDLEGTGLSWGQDISVGRVNWIGNFRHGFSASVSNSYSYNLEAGTDVTSAVSADLTGYWSFFDRFGASSRIMAFTYLSDDDSDNIADDLRGILDKRIDDVDTYINFNFDAPVKILDVDFLSITGVSWTKYIGFEMHASPFFDMMLTHDPKTNRLFSLKDGWYSGGLELIVYPKKMRSIYGRISAGFDLGDMAENGWKMESYSKRDGESTREIFIGIGLQY